MFFWSGHCLVHMSLHSVRGVAIGAEKGGGRVLLEKQQLFWAGHCLVWSVLHNHSPQTAKGEAANELKKRGGRGQSCCRCWKIRILQAYQQQPIRDRERRRLPRQDERRVPAFSPHKSRIPHQFTTLEMGIFVRVGLAVSNQI